MRKTRPTLAEFSPDVLAVDNQGQRLDAQNHKARELYRRLTLAPPMDHATRIAKIAAGETVAPVADDATQRREAANLCRDLEEARDLHHNQSHAVRHTALKALCKSVEAEHDAILKRMAVACVEAYAANSAFQELKDYLIAQGGLVGICLTDTAKIFGHANDRTSDFAIMLREFVTLGALSKMPEGIN
jgi:hypothetical protein